MGKLVVLSLGEGDFQRGFPVTLQVWEEGGFHTSFLGKLPASAIDSLYDRWQSDYRQKVSGRMTPKPAQVSNRSDTDLIANSKLLKDELNNWLNSETFRPIKEKFLEKVNTRETVRVIVQTENPQLRRLPWYLWDLFESYRFAEVALSSPTFDRAHKSVQPKAKVRILAILGDSSPPDPLTGIRLDINADKQFLDSLPDAEVVFLLEPKSHEFHEQLWDDRGWDILFFAGHSSSQPDGTTGKMYINSQESLTVEDLKLALKKAIERGLQLAIFNSCDGLGIARDLAELQIPQIIAMREPVPDCVAKEFLKYFLTSFSSGNILYLAVREARERLHGVEKESPCASWLPVICQNPAENSVTWQELRGIAPGINWRDTCHRSIPERGKLTSNSLVANDGLNLNVDDVYVPLGLVERQQKPKPDREIKPEQGSQLYGAETQYEVTKTYKNDEFFEELLKQGKTDKTRGKRIAIIGEPGAGKTTLLQKIADWVLAETEVVPIWVSLADLGKFSLEDYLLQKWLKIALNVADVTLEMRQDLVTLFNNHQVWLLLDGADEMSAGNPLDEIKAQLQGWVAEARVVLTCRYNVWDAGKNALAEFDVYRNLDFDENEQIPRFIRSVFRNSDLGEKLCANLAELENTRLRDTVKNPLRLTLLCLAWHIRQGDFTTKTQADLYAQFSEALYEWKREQFPTTSQQRRELNKALATLALRGMEEEESRFRLRQSWVREVLGETDKPLCELALQLGWINRVGVATERPEEQVYAFYHPTFQEYFAALGVDDWRYFLNHVPDNPRLGTYRIFEKVWENVILLWLGRENLAKDRKEEFIRVLVEFEDGIGNYEFYKDRAYLLAFTGMAEFQNCSKVDGIVAEIVKWSLGYFCQESQQWSKFIEPVPERARAILYKTKPIKAIVPLVATILNYPQANYSDNRAVNLLREIATEHKRGVISALSILINDTQDYNVFESACSSLTVIGKDEPIAILSLVRGFWRSSCTDSLYNRIKELEEIAKGNVIAINALCELILNHPHELNRRSAIYCLGEIGEEDSTVITTLLELIKNSQDRETIYSAIRALGKLSQCNLNAIDALVSLLQDSQYEEFRIEVAFVLQNNNPNSPIATGILLDYFQNNPNNQEDCIWSIKLRIVCSLLNNIHSHSLFIDFLKQCIQNSAINYNVAASILGEIGQVTPQAVEALVELIQQVKENEKLLQIARVLWRFDSKKSLAAHTLLKIINNSFDESICCQVINTLGEAEKDNTIVIDVLTEIIQKHQDTIVRYFAAHRMLGKFDINNAIAITTLGEFLQNYQGKIVPHITLLSPLLSSDFTLNRDIIYRLFREDLYQSSKSHPTVIATLIKVIQKSQNQEIRLMAVDCLVCFDRENPIILSFLIEIIQKIIQTNETQERKLDNIEVMNICRICQENVDAINDVHKLIQISQNEENCQKLAYFLFKIDQNYHIGFTTLVKLIKNSNNENTRIQEEIQLALLDFDKSNPTSITTLTELIQNCQNTKIRQEAAKYLSIIDPNNSIALTPSIDFIFNYQPDELNKFNYQDTVRSLKPGYIFSPTTKFGMQRVITILREYLSKEIYNNWGYSACCEILWEYAENMPYLDFYEAWYNQPTTHPEAPDNIPVGNTLLTQSLENQINDILTQLQPTTQTYPLPINIQSLTDETDINAICQELCTQIYYLALPDTDIPGVNNFAELKRHILTAKRQLQKRHLALILHECTPHPTLITCCRKIADANLGLHILWITDTPLDAPLRGFPPQQPNLLGAIQTWINELN